MATRFELVLYGDDEGRLRSAGEEAIREIKRIAKRFSFYDPASELSQVNRAASDRPVRVSGELFDLLSLCQNIYQYSHGAFDPTVGPLLRAWGFTSGAPERPGESELRGALNVTGFENVSLERSDNSVRFRVNGIELDLGGIAKGWALDECKILLKDAGIDCALLHGGTSSVLTIGGDSKGEPWRIGIEDPYKRENPDESGEHPPWFTHCDLLGTALSVSAIHGKSFVHNDTEYGHVIDPRTGHSITGPIVSAVTGFSAALADAWSTAMLVATKQDCHFEFQNVNAAASFEKVETRWTLRSGVWDGFPPP